jgi:hypothetical protein
MHPALFAYLKSIGQIPSEIEDDESKYPDDWYIYTPPTPPTTDIREDQDFSHLFPLPPDYEWPSGDTSSEIPDVPAYTTPPGTGGGGSAINCSNGHMFSAWGGNCASAPKTRVLFQSPGQVTGQTRYFYTSVHSRLGFVWRKSWRMSISGSNRSLRIPAVT